MPAYDDTQLSMLNTSGTQIVAVMWTTFTVLFLAPIAIYCILQLYRRRKEVLLTKRFVPLALASTFVYSLNIATICCSFLYLSGIAGDSSSNNISLSLQYFTAPQPFLHHSANILLLVRFWLLYFKFSLSHPFELPPPPATLSLSQTDECCFSDGGPLFFSCNKLSIAHVV